MVRSPCGRPPADRSFAARTTTPSPTPRPFLLQDALEEARFEYHTTAQIAELSPGALPRPIGTQGMIESLELSPDGRYLLIERIVGPLSPLVPHRSFARTLEILDLGGTTLATLRERPLQEGRAPGARPDRDLPREVAWLPDGSGLGFLQREQPESDGEAEEPANSDEDSNPETASCGSTRPSHRTRR